MDMYDALTSERVYKKAASHEQATKIIRENRRTHFDPAVVDAYVCLESVVRPCTRHEMLPTTKEKPMLVEVRRAEARAAA